MMKGKFPEIFSQFYGFPAVSLGHHTVQKIDGNAVLGLKFSWFLWHFWRYNCISTIYTSVISRAAMSQCGQTCVPGITRTNHWNGLKFSGKLLLINIKASTVSFSRFQINFPSTTYCKMKIMKPSYDDLQIRSSHSGAVWREIARR